MQQLFQRAEFTVYGISKELDNVRHRETTLRDTSGEEEEQEPPWPCWLTHQRIRDAVAAAECAVVACCACLCVSDLTNSRIQWFSIFSIFVLLAVSTWQIVYLRSFFRSKKLL